MENHSSDHEGFHLPSPSIAPVIVAGGITFVLVGLLNFALLIVGAVLLIVGIALWAFGPN